MAWGFGKMEQFRVKTPAAENASVRKNKVKLKIERERQPTQHNN
jgi:hypothetical protein